MNWKKIRLDSLLAFFSQSFYKLVGFIVLAILTRYLSKDDMGAFFFAATLTSFGAMLTDLGTGTWLTRKVASDAGRGGVTLGRVLSLRIPLVLAYFLAINLFSWFFRHEINRQRKKDTDIRCSQKMN